MRAAVNFSSLAMFCSACGNTRGTVLLFLAALLSPSNSPSAGMATLLCRVQYLNDGDPFACTSTCYLEPPSPVTYVFSIHLPVADQLAAVIRTLRAPHKVHSCDTVTSARAHIFAKLSTLCALKCGDVLAFLVFFYVPKVLERAKSVEQTRVRE